MRRIVVFAVAAIVGQAVNGASNNVHAAAWQFFSAEGNEAEEAGSCWMSDGNVQLFYRPHAGETSDAIILYFNDPILHPDGKDLRVIVNDREYRAEYHIDDGEMGLYYTLPMDLIQVIGTARFLRVTDSVGTSYIINTSDIAGPARDFAKCIADRH